jgi:hypothetical protein
MKRYLLTRIYALVVILFISIALLAQDGYKNFGLAIYCNQSDMRQMTNQAWLDSSYKMLSKYIHFNKVYLETHRNLDIIEKENVLKIKKFFQDKGIEVSGGITYVVNERNKFQTFCYTKAADRKKVQEIAEYTASLFDEIILDDFFFTNCKCVECIKAKGDKTWTQYRLELMTEVSKNLIIGPAKKVNPNVNIIIKYPNWYDHFQFSGYNLETEPKLFDMIYTGTETRDPVYTQQHLQPYQSYGIMRYFENIAPGRNGGGWVDPGSRQYIDRYSEQIALTLFAKAKEQTLFCFGDMIQMINNEQGIPIPSSDAAPAAGYQLDKIDAFIAKLGNPIGIKSYKPYQSSGEDFLQSFIGMLGIPMDIVPEFPTEAPIVFLTEQAAFDKDILSKIKAHLTEGKNVIITSGLYHALQGKGIGDIVELELTNKKATVHQFYNWQGIIFSEKDILIPQMRYATNDSWDLISGLENGLGYPILQEASYANGKMYILTIPDNFDGLYDFPREILTQIKKIVMTSLFVYTDTPAKICIFEYDNNCFIIHSFKEFELPINVVLDKKFSKVVDLESNKETMLQTVNDKSTFTTRLNPHTYKVFQAK